MASEMIVVCVKCGMPADDTILGYDLMCTWCTRSERDKLRQENLALEWHLARMRDALGRFTDCNMCTGRWPDNGHTCDVAGAYELIDQDQTAVERYVRAALAYVDWLMNECEITKLPAGKTIVTGGDYSLATATRLEREYRAAKAAMEAGRNE